MEKIVGDQFGIGGVHRAAALVSINSYIYAIVEEVFFHNFCGSVPVKMLEAPAQKDLAYAFILSCFNDPCCCSGNKSGRA